MKDGRRKGRERGEERVNFVETPLGTINNYIYLGYTSVW